MKIKKTLLISITFSSLFTSATFADVVCNINSIGNTSTCGTMVYNIYPNDVPFILENLIPGKTYTCGMYAEGTNAYQVSTKEYAGSYNVQVNQETPVNFTVINLAASTGMVRFKVHNGRGNWKNEGNYAFVQCSP